MRSIGFDWHTRDIKATGGSPWRTQFLKRLLCAPTLVGQREHEGVLYPGTWEPIFSLEDHRRLKEFFGMRSGNKRPATVSLLTGHIHCGTCGARTFACRRSDKARRYVCKKTPGTGACGKMTILAEPLEALVAEMLFYVVDDDALRAHVDQRGDEDEGIVEAIRRDEEGCSPSRTTSTSRA